MTTLITAAKETNKIVTLYNMRRKERLTAIIDSIAFLFYSKAVSHYHSIIKVTGQTRPTSPQVSLRDICSLRSTIGCDKSQLSFCFAC